jgi:folate-binding protein YgfZ
MYEDVLRQSRCLPQFAALVVRGTDAASFLQGQISADLRQVDPAAVLLASVNSAQGRVQDVAWIAPRGNDLLLITRAEMAEQTATRLKKYVLRSKVSLERAPYAIAGTLPDGDSSAWTAPLTQSLHGDYSIIEWPGRRKLIIGPESGAGADDAFAQTWQQIDVAAGVPTIHPGTHELFVAQMLNLDLLGGISFEKGCYTGQEIIARTHFRGSVKRRMFRFSANCPAPAPGTKLTAGGSPAAEVVTSVAVGSGCEFLAVVQLAHLDEALVIDGLADVEVAREALPYALA